jgi:hypothetical protein
MALAWVVSAIAVLLIIFGAFAFSGISNWSHDRAIESCIRNNYIWHDDDCLKTIPEEEK